jgi:hypothetical protein
MHTERVHENAEARMHNMLDDKGNSGGLMNSKKDEREQETAEPSIVS